jgi:hypothetical protein
MIRRLVTALLGGLILAGLVLAGWVFFGFGVFPFRQVGVTAAGTPIYAKPLPDGVRHQSPEGPVLPRDMSVFLKVGADDYIAYGISGGPQPRAAWRLDPQCLN